MNRQDWIETLHEFVADVRDGAYDGEEKLPRYSLTPADCEELMALLEGA